MPKGQKRHGEQREFPPGPEEHHSGRGQSKKLLEASKVKEGGFSRAGRREP